MVRLRSLRNAAVAIGTLAVALGWHWLGGAGASRLAPAVNGLWQRAVAPGALSQSHAFLAGQCAACHAPLSGVRREACVACHAGETDLLARQPTAFHARIDACTGCHREHADATRMTSVMEHESLGRPDQALECAACHVSRDRHQGFFGLRCDQCHRTVAWTVRGFRHPSSRSTQCLECHRAPPSHYMDHFEMVSRPMAGDPTATVEACYRCHQTTAWNDIKRAGFVKHH
jgi:hypothetical protein